MPPSSTSVIVALILGPQASGKSTVANALVDVLRGRNEHVARVELDEIAAMALPTLPSWEVAGQIFASVIGEWARSELTCVVAEGIASQRELEVVTAQVPETAAITTIVMTTAVEIAAPRALADPTRGISRDERWLAERYDEWQDELARIDEDLDLGMGRLSVEQGVALAVSAIEVTRTRVLQCSAPRSVARARER